MHAPQITRCVCSSVHIYRNACLLPHAQVTKLRSEVDKQAKALIAYEKRITSLEMVGAWVSEHIPKSDPAYILKPDPAYIPKPDPAYGTVP